MDLERLVDELLDAHGVPGAAAAVVDGDGNSQVVMAGRRGDGHGPVDGKTVFAAASLTKPVFASGVMALADAGGLELDRPLGEYGPGLDIADDGRAASITARMVLAHTTGLPNWRRDDPLFLRWPPGSRWGYSGEGYVYLQTVVEAITGLTLGHYLADAVLEPLGMNDSGFSWTEVDETREAVGHSATGGPRPRFRPPAAKAAAGGLMTTAPDYLRFLAHSLADGHRSFEPQVRIDDQLAWGLGWGIEEGDTGRAIWQWGSDPGYKNFAIGRPADRTGVVVFTNGDRGAPVYTEVVRRILPGPHPSLQRHDRPAWRRAMAVRPVDLTSRLDDPPVQALLEIVARSGNHQDIGRVASRYQRADSWFLGIQVETSWEPTGPAHTTPIGCIGIEPGGRAEAAITALAVLPDWRHQGFFGGEPRRAPPADRTLPLPPRAVGPLIGRSGAQRPAHDTG